MFYIEAIRKTEKGTLVCSPVKTNGKVELWDTDGAASEVANRLNSMSGCSDGMTEFVVRRRMCA